MIDFEVAYDKLAGLETADEIADLMRDYGIKAEPCESRKCAISVWMEGQTGLSVSTNLAYTRAIIVNRLDDDGMEYYIDHPGIEEKDHTEAMAKFIENFDTYKYPDLIKRGA